MAKHMWCRRDTGITLGLLGGAVGAAGWILGMANELLCAPAPPPGILLDILIVCLCAFGVLLMGVFVWYLYLSGRRMSVVAISEMLLGASAVFGTLALVWIQTRGVLPLAVGGFGGAGQPGNEVWEAIGRHTPPEIAYVAPLLILSFMVLIGWPLNRVLGANTHIQRATFEVERPVQSL